MEQEETEHKWTAKEIIIFGVVFILIIVFASWVYSPEGMR
jgi:hypothetical protein